MIDKEQNKKAYHYKILATEGFIDAILYPYLGIINYKNGHPNMSWEGAIRIHYTGLSLSGHQILEAMRNDSLWSKIKSNAQVLGIEGLKQIPHLALELLKRGEI